MGASPVSGIVVEAVVVNPHIVERDCSGWETLPSSWPDCLRRVLAARGVRRQSELYYELPELPRPDLMLGMDTASALLADAVEKQWRITVVADFDSDGATSCALAMRGLRAMGLTHIDAIVPNRFLHGYGLTPELLADIPSDKQPDLLLTVDNGIAAIEGVEAAHRRGMKVLVTDHHLAGERLPAADAIINPNQPGDTFPSRNLAGVGVCFYLLLGLRQRLRERDWFERQHIDEPRLVDLLDLVALGTIADVVPLDRLNRTLVETGLGRVRRGQCCAGIRALCHLSGREPATLTASDLAFSIAPRLNAAGRMEDMRLGIALLLEDEFDTALSAAGRLDAINIERRAVERDMQQDALAMLQGLELDGVPAPGYCLYDPGWHQGVIGLLASRIKEHVHRPVIAFAPGDQGEIKGSARSIPGVHIRDVLARVASQRPDILKRFGGHAMAAGMTMEEAHLADFRALFLAVLDDMVDPSLYRQTLASDGVLSIEEFDLQLAELLPRAAPWGQGFEEPRFHGRFRVAGWREVGADASHLRLSLALPDGRQLTAMAFRQQRPDWLDTGGEVLIRYRLNVNSFRDVKSLQLLVDDLLPA